VIHISSFMNVQREIGCGAIRPEVLRRINWTMVLPHFRIGSSVFTPEAYVFSPSREKGRAHYQPHRS
jgi:hypothetical protein